MSIREILEVCELMEHPGLSGQTIARLLQSVGAPDCEITIESVPYEAPEDTRHNCDFVRVLIPGRNGSQSGGEAATLGIVGRLGAQQAQPKRVGYVSDADGSIVAIASALRLLRLAVAGFRLIGDVIITTHVATHVSITPRKPVDFMGTPVSSDRMNEFEVDQGMDAILSFDASKGNQLINHRGIAISPTAKKGYLLPVAPDLLPILEYATGEPARTFPLAQQDITPYSNGLRHFNSIMQPAVATSAPVVGVALTATSVVPGSSTGASYETVLLDAVRFAVETAKQFTAGALSFYNKDEYAQLTANYGELSQFQQ
ncbi:DUF1177 domain-containing protein [Auritidibacter sp. NML130574]|uniref:DUF1177 domain-containing protein n=1 Tax=Auritidibacter sp. NML130574 TaxID=2170745 RepID=UPI000D729C8A|nr:DUF1177 domain-containing protein [Auritidibacter sp. NML130574]AXR73567.1 DUF1177 domain-containing protein [Auritidibacter sp. NML130574]